MCLAPCWLAGRPVPLHGLLLHILPEAVHSAEEDDLPAQRRVTFWRWLRGAALLAGA